ncbi:MAG TPA: hypothetical protein VHG72_15300 [Polyangia bacterium]|nr:hypothetical protein [Polyangia bacterium]
MPDDVPPDRRPRPPSDGAYRLDVATIIQQKPAASSAARPSVELDVGGADFMLRGKFADWESGLAFGPDLDRVNVRLAIDATSGVTSGEDLFGFHSRNVEPVGNGLYRAVGTFSGAQGERPGELLIESPLGHTALIVVMFSARKEDFGESWHDLIQNAVPFPGQGEEGPVRSARGWLVAPHLAAA